MKLRFSPGIDSVVSGYIFDLDGSIVSGYTSTPIPNTGWQYVDLGSGISNGKYLLNTLYSGYIISTNVFEVKSASDIVAGDTFNDSSSGNGSYVFTVNVRSDLDDTVISGALVEIRESSGLYRVVSGRTDSSGNVQFLLEAGLYKIYISYTNYVSLLGFTTTISNDSSVNLELTPSTISVSSDPDLCALNIYCFNNIPIEGCHISAELLKTNSYVDTNIIPRTLIRGTTDVNGYCQLILIRSIAFTNGDGYYRILAKDKFGKTFHDRTVAMPNSSSANLTDLPTI